MNVIISNIYLVCMLADMQEGPECVAAYLSKERIAESFQVLLVGPEGQTDLLMSKAKQLPGLRVNTKRIYNFLAVRHGLGVHMQHATWAVPSLEHLDLIFSDISEYLVNNARRVTNESELAVASLVGNDVANVRGDVDDEDVPDLSSASTNPADDESNSDDIPILDHRGVLSVNGNGGSGALHAAIRVCLQGVLQTVKPTTRDNTSSDFGGDVPSHGATMHLPRSSDAINEFTNNDTALYGVFWYEFLLSKGLGSGSVNLASRRHMLLQFSGRFARNQEFIFLLANQTIRHMNSRAVNAQVKSNDKGVQGFKELVNDVEFIPDLEKGIKNPGGKEAARILRRIQPLLVSCSSKVPFSAVARNADITKLYNFRRCFGLPALFITVSPDDVHNPMVLRLTCWTSACDGFPTTDDGFSQALRDGITEFMTGSPAAEGVIRLDESSLRRIVGDNPVAAAEVFDRMLRTIWRVLFGLEPSHMKGIGTKRTFPLYTSSHCTPPLGRFKHPGLFGYLSAAFGCTEEQTRKALHHHVLGWGGIPPELMQSLFPKFIVELGDMLNTMIRAEVSTEVHIADLIRREMHLPARRNVYHESPSVDDPHFQNHADVVSVSVGLHEHSLTCW